MDTLSQRLPSGTTLEEWDEAYRRVEAYLSALRIRNKLVLAALTNRVLRETENYIRDGARERPAALASTIIDQIVLDWFRRVLETNGENPREVSLRGRLALLLTDLPTRWQDQFLSDPPWPDEFLQAMRSNFVSSGPDFQLARMAARPLNLGVLPTLADNTLRGLDRLPWVRTGLLWIVIGGLFGLLFYLTR